MPPRPLAHKGRFGSVSTRVQCCAALGLAVLGLASAASAALTPITYTAAGLSTTINGLTLNFASTTKTLQLAADVPTSVTDFQNYTWSEETSLPTAQDSSGSLNRNLTVSSVVGSQTISQSADVAQIGLLSKGYFQISTAAPLTYTITGVGTVTFTLWSDSFTSAPGGSGSRNLGATAEFVPVPEASTTVAGLGTTALVVTLLVSSRKRLHARQPQA